MSYSHLIKKLADDAVVLRHEDGQETGARSIEPDHAAREQYRQRSLPKRGIDLPTAAGATQHRVEQFLFHQAELLDGKHWAAYIDLFDDSGMYWMPVSPEQSDWLDSPSIFAEDKPLMQIRMGRVTHPSAWSQAPLWGTSHLLGNVVIEAETAAAITVRSRFQMMELRRDNVRHFAGTYRHELARTGDDFRIRLQRVDLLNGQAVFDYVLQVWV